MPESALLFIHCLSGLHPGSGTALGVVDLPVQRERHTDWPTVPGSSLKGVLRAACSAAAQNDETLFAAFGPETGNASDHAGAVSISDARLLAFPVRSLKGVFAWTTCGDALSRLRRDLEVLGGDGFPDAPEAGENRAACVDGSPLIVDGDRVVLEEFEFERVDGGGEAAAVADWIARRAVSDEPTAARLKRHLTVIGGDEFTHFARHATEVTARVGLHPERKTVRDGALFYEEFLPPETLFYAVVTAERSRREGVAMNAGEVLGWLRRTAPRFLRVGGGETVGKGLCAVRFAAPAEEAAP